MNADIQLKRINSFYSKLSKQQKERKKSLYKEISRKLNNYKQKNYIVLEHLDLTTPVVDRSKRAKVKAEKILFDLIKQFKQL